MSIIAALMTATFTAPEEIRTNPQSILWLLPITAAIAIIYKAIKLPTITAASFTKETAILFSSIIVVIAIIASALCTLAQLLAQ